MLGAARQIFVIFLVSNQLLENQLLEKPWKNIGQKFLSIIMLYSFTHNILSKKKIINFIIFFRNCSTIGGFR